MFATEHETDLFICRWHKVASLLADFFVLFFYGGGAGVAGVAGVSVIWRQKKSEYFRRSQQMTASSGLGSLFAAGRSAPSVAFSRL